jgi:MEDS: MEthanogen/methylotroph, DcmR Sensory domain
MDLEPPLRDAIDAGWCPHLAMLLRRPDEVAPTLASFYALGAQRNGWLFHRSVSGSADTDREALARAGLDVAGLEAQGRMAFTEIGLDGITPEQWVTSWEPAFEDALARGFDAAWWARFPIGPDEEIMARSDAFDRAWDERFHGRPCVSLCLFIVGELEAPAEEAHVERLAQMHDAVLVPEVSGPSLVRTPGR